MNCTSLQGHTSYFPGANVWFNWESCFSQHHGQVFKKLGDGCYARNARNSWHWNAQLTVMWPFETKITKPTCYITCLSFFSRWCTSLHLSGGSLIVGSASNPVLEDLWLRAEGTEQANQWVGAALSVAPKGCEWTRHSIPYPTITYYYYIYTYR